MRVVRGRFIDRLDVASGERSALAATRFVVGLTWALVIASSLAPFDFGPLGEAPFPHFSVGAIGDAADVLALLLHVVVFALIGAIDRVGGADATRPVMPTRLARALGWCVAIEVGQAFLPNRHAEGLDLVTNLAGVTVGHVSGGALRFLLALIGGTLTKLPSLSAFLRSMAMVTWVLFWGAAVVLPARFVALDDWDASYPLLLGNERGDGRRWAGELEYVAFYNRALGVDEIAGLSLSAPSGKQVLLPAGLIVAFDFTHAGELVARPVPGRIAASLGLSVPAGTRWRSGQPSALVLGAGPGLASAGSAGSLTRAIATTGTFSIEVWGRPTDIVQEGPTRIVSISNSLWRRNVTIGQDGSGLSVRIRNRLTGVNATNLEIFDPGALSTNRHHVVVTYAQGLVSTFVDGRRRAPVLDLREPSVLLGLGPSMTSHAATAFFAAATLILAGAAMAQRWSRSLIGLFVCGYGTLLVSLVIGHIVRFEVAPSLFVWFGPCLVLSRFWMTGLLARASRGGL